MASALLSSIWATIRRYPLASGVLAVYLAFRLLRPTKPRRPSRIPCSEERVVILGASGGIGRALARKYAARGARVCLVGRREAALRLIADECRALQQDSPAAKGVAENERIMVVKADCTNVDDMVALRTTVEAAWGGLDTLMVSAGVATLKPCLEVARVGTSDRGFSPPHADRIGIVHLVDIANKALQPNYLGPLIAAVTFIPLLTATSTAPSIMLLSTLAAVIPAPTLALYCASKSASLLLYQALAMEHPAVAFTCVLPSTVRGQAFFAAAVDGGSIRPGAADPDEYGLTPEAVAERAVEAVDGGDKLVLIPGRAYVAHALYWIAPSVVARFARKRYNYPPM
ncbi:NAD-P-binding protein [Trametes sanguinea]|nr:NAD-P-binding protein [Trametes sanguinea]